MKSFPYPIPADALDEFCGVGMMARPVRIDGETIVANGLVCVRVSIGRWLAGDFEAAGAEFMERIGKLPWARIGGLPSDGWHDLDAVRVVMRKRGQIAMRNPVGGQVLASPVWRLGHVPVRLSVLMAVAKLPRVEVAWDDDRESPIWFRFSGGSGIIAADRRLVGAVPGRTLFKGGTDLLTGRVERHKIQPAKPSFSLPNWPPVDQSEY